MRWRFLDTGVGDGPYNMAVDEALLVRCAARRSPPVVRLYRWSPWTVSLGRMQDAGRLNRERCAEDAVPIVRRPTGGRAVFHAEEVTYSFVASLEDLPSAPTVGETYRFVASVLVEALRSLGVPAEVASASAEVASASAGDPGVEVPGDSPGAGSIRRSPCFASVSRYEICVAGRKLVGSAQRRWPGAVLQHGSILTGPAHCRIARYLAGGSGALEERLKKRTTSIEAIVGRKVDTAELGACLRRASGDVWGLDMVEDTLGRAEAEAARRLVRSKYGTPGWTDRVAREPEPAPGAPRGDEP